jgi:uncharacterized protein YbaA (DUF1428 family)
MQNSKNYVDGFVIPVRKDKMEEYRAVAAKAALVWKELGALEYFECVGDDLDNGKEFAAFPKIAGASDEETVVFSWIVYESREHRDAVNAKVMEDPRIKEMCDDTGKIFDCKRMAYGGFRVIVKE